MVQERETKVEFSQLTGTQQTIKAKFLYPILEKASGLSKVKKIYSGELSQCDEDEFLEKAIQILKLKYDLDLNSLQNIPSEGPVILVANHPFGVHDALLLNTILKEARPDYKIMANGFFTAIEPLKERLILVDAFTNKNKENLTPLKQSVKFLKNGGALGVFPAGSVSHLEVNKKHVTDSEWSSTIAGLVEMTGATVVPIFFSGRNSRSFNILGMLNDKLRTAMLPREIFKSKKRISVKIGRAISGAYLKSLPNRRQMADYLKMRCYLLSDISNKNIVECREDARKLKKVAPPLPVEELINEIDALPTSVKLINYKDLSVFCCRSKSIPNILHEIGRLREITFREVEEGSGQELDLDEYDEKYLHLFIWNHSKNEVVGAYRMGEVDKLLEEGVSSLYTSNFYQYNNEFLEEHKCALEMGRSFIRKEYQRKPYSLLLLWRGICTYIVRNPQYKYLFGAVSMSDDYDPRSRALTAALLLDRQHQLQAIAPVNIPVHSEIKEFCKKYSFEKSEDLSQLVKGIEKDGKDIPVLIKQYMKLGGRFHSFSVDEDFGNTLDGLIVVDLTKAPDRSLKQYMGEGTQGYLDFHRQQ
ncbi:MAG: lysophospholipid acyltransferase family protein [Lentisphaerales bacterium]|nr:lysophospholipid acyltransferase family protein [Lentisphaerales bacterium]